MLSEAGVMPSETKCIVGPPPPPPPPAGGPPSEPPDSPANAAADMVSIIAPASKQANAFLNISFFITTPFLVAPCGQNPTPSQIHAEHDHLLIFRYAAASIVLITQYIFIFLQ